MIKHQTKKESQMVLCVLHFQTPWLVSPQNVYTIAFVYLLSFLQDLCSGIMLVQFKLCASLYGSDVQNQWGSLRPNLKSQMEMSHKISISSPEATYTVGLLSEGAECGSLWISSNDHEGLFYIFFFHSLHSPWNNIGHPTIRRLEVDVGVDYWLIVIVYFVALEMRRQRKQAGKWHLDLDQHPWERNKGSHGDSLAGASLD